MNEKQTQTATRIYVPIEKAILFLANVCDGAVQHDDVGFNKPDTEFGHKLARFIQAGNSLNEAQIRVAYSILQKYHRQLGAAGINIEEAITINPKAISDELLAGVGKVKPIIVSNPISMEMSKALATPFPIPVVVVNPSPSPSPAPAPSPKLTINEAAIYTSTQDITAAVKSSITLNEEQSEAIDMILAWLEKAINGKADQIFKLGGYAGTGKTTLIKFLRELTKKSYPSLVCAFTGKACNVLQKKGIQAATIHSTIYDCQELPSGEISFRLKDHLEYRPKLIIIDEASMLSTDLYKDLCSFGIPMLCVGDPGQLEPVGDNPNLMKSPDFVLNKIHRQAEQSAIITLANSIRNGGALRYGKLGNDEVDVRSKKINFSAQDIINHEQGICAKNATRHKLNDAVRMTKGFPPQEIVVGDKIICFRNNRSYGVFNGQIFFVTAIKQDFFEYWLCDCTDEVGKVYHDLRIWKKPFQEEIDKVDYVPRDVIYCQYGYVITCHKSQGSEWESVIVYDEWMPPKVWDMKRWRYTAITRASKKITILM